MHLFRVIFLTSVLYLFSGCTIIMPAMSDGYITHEEAMSKFRTKQDVLNRFGSPSEKDKVEGIEIWHYSFGYRTAGNSMYTPYGRGVLGSQNSVTYERYVEFQFSGNNVVNWRTQGVNLKNGTSKSELFAYGLLIDMCVLIALLTL